MSLINKMLKDLEKRDAFLNENSDQVLDGLYSAYDLELSNKKKSNSLFMIFFCLVSLAIVSVCIYFYYKNNTDQSISFGNKLIIDEKHELSPDSVKEDIETEKESAAEFNLLEDEVIAEITSEIEINNNKYHSLKLDEQLLFEEYSEPLTDTKVNRIESIHFETDSAGINLIINMPDEIDYLVYGLTNPERTVIEVKNVELRFRLEDLEPVGPIVAIRYSINDEKRFKLVLESEVPLTIRKSVTGVSGTKHDLIVMMESHWDEKEKISQEDNELAAIVEQQVEYEKNTVFKGNITKTPVSQNTDAYIEKMFQEAYMLYKRGKTSDSLKELNTVLNLDPGHVKARSTLALVLSEKEHYELAYSVLNEGLIQYPQNVEWTKMYARLLLNEDKIIEARNMLEKQKPALALNTEYYALQAAVFQKLNEHNEAARIYRDLLHISPLKAVWWMGLGISLESLKRYDDALYAYQKASNNSSLAKESHQFLTQRINRLNSILEDEST